ncbi:MAG: N-6 DNA methylase [Candidatus Woesearchaeota archaeon]
MATKEEALIKLKKLVNDYNSNKEKYYKMLEANVETKLIEELFIGVLGWSKKDFEKQAKAKRGQKTGHADYAFKIGEKIVFYLEVKQVNISLDKEADKQVISYSLSKRISFAVSTNFRTLKIFCVEDEKNSVFRLFNSPEEYISRFDDLYYLSKESFEKNELLNRASQEQRLKQRISIGKELLKDFMYARKLISDDIEANYPKEYSIENKDEIVQRILDRLIFIRRCEDIGINPNNISLEELKHLPQNKVYSRLKDIFKVYDKVYNSGLFTPAKDNDCDKIEVNGRIMQNLTYILYESKDKRFIYNFDWIDADVLGQVYEQYLGKILAQTKSGRSKLKDGQVHRKEQGIYYTPTYIVDYIVKNTIGELLKDKKIKAKEIKILDPSCGSGSFLIKAFDYLYEFLSKYKDSTQHKLDFQGHHSIKTDILKKNIYGVDLDNKAVEITKLNLLLKAAEFERRLPEELDLHIKHGNSLIDDGNIAGLNAFKWHDDFQEGSFDIVIGNPPYFNLQTLKDKVQVDFFNRTYDSYRGKADVLYLFLEKANKLLKEGGYLGFIVANYFMKSHYADKLREFITQKYQLVKILDFGSIKVFQEANVDTCILILRKHKPKKNKFWYAMLKDEKALNEFMLDTTKKNDNISTSFIIKKELQDNITSKPWRFEEDRIPGTTPLSHICNIGKGIATGNDNIFVIEKDLAKKLQLENEILDKVVEDSSIYRYSFRLSNNLLIRTKRGTNLVEYPNVKKYLESKKEIIKKRYAVLKEGLNWYEIVRYNEDLFGSEVKEQIYAYYRSVHNKFAYSTTRYVTLTTSFAITLKPNKKINLKFLLAILNSKYIEHFAQKNAKKMGNCFEYSSNFIGSIPIKLIEEKQQNIFIKLVDRIILLNKKIYEYGNKKTFETAKLEEEIRKIDDEIDRKVYKLYGITDKEKQIIEGSVK